MQHPVVNAPKFFTVTKGSYILIVNLPEEEIITVGKLPARRFSKGYYAYVGSALNGLKARLDRHLRDNKKPHWHIDYLLKKASITGIIACETEHKVECTIAESLTHQFDFVPGFGSSDCHCKSHLFFDTDEKKMRSAVISATKELGLQPRLVVGLK